MIERGQKKTKVIGLISHRVLGRSEGGNVGFFEGDWMKCQIKLQLCYGKITRLAYEQILTNEGDGDG